MQPDIRPGVMFDTPYESGCVATSVPDDHGVFSAVDSEGIECTYVVAMVVHIHTDNN